MHVPSAYYLVMPLLQLCNQTAHQLVNSSLPLTTANADTCSLNAEIGGAQDMHWTLQPRLATAASIICQLKDTAAS